MLERDASVCRIERKVRLTIDNPLSLAPFIFFFLFTLYLRSTASPFHGNSISLLRLTRVHVILKLISKESFPGLLDA